ncbi:MAG TPA: hypothetical protein VI457_03095 [Methylococcaceae bacterium]|nr:hypothetical protein [Methylococcaceae bacterium]
MTTKTKCLVVLSLIAVVDILPIPVLGMIAFFVILTTPRWFLDLVIKLYRESEAHEGPPPDPE